MSLMKFAGNPDTVVKEHLLGIKSNFPSLTVDVKKRIIIYKNIKPGKICLLSGGGSGHEPFAAGFVGSNLLSAAVAGSVFSSPPTAAIYDAICALAEKNRNAGILIFVMNYTGDILNFGLATEKAKTNHIKVENVIISEDCSRTGDEVLGAGKRGMCGKSFAMKIGGGMTSSGMSLSEIARECTLINENMATLGAAVTSCTVPGVGPLFSVNNDEIVIGVGIHGETGMQRKKLLSIDDLVDEMLSKITQTLHLDSGAEVCVLVNNLGSVSVLEMNVISGKVHTWLDNRNIAVHRLYSGLMMTSLDMAGIQLSVLNTINHPDWIKYLDYETDAIGWRGTQQSVPSGKGDSQIMDYDVEILIEVGPKISPDQAKLFKNCIEAITVDLINAEQYLNELDSKIGDGDSGTTLRSFANGINSASDIQYDYPAVAFYQLSKIFQDAVGGTSGALYGILLNSATQYLRTTAEIDWVALGKAAIDKLLWYSKAKLGDRTMVDSLLPAYEEFCKVTANNESVEKACAAATDVARKRCKETKYMKARLGRASYVPEEYMTDVDPGAYAVTVWLNAICRTLENA